MLIASLKPFCATLLLVLAAFAPARAEDTLPTIPITKAMEIAGARYEGQLVSADLGQGRPEEKTDLVYQFRWLTPQGNILNIRIDARDGAILDVEGAGLTAARKREGDAP